MLEHALQYIALGWHILPLHPRDKRPATAHGVKDASTNAADIERWWSEVPFRNIGLACGVSGIVAVDIDPRNGGDQSWADLLDINQDGTLPATLEAETGSGGRHILFKHPGFPVKNRSIAKGVDIKADNGYIVVAPSVHPFGPSYRWLNWGTPIADAPEWLAAMWREPDLPRFAPPRIAVPDDAEERCMKYLEKMDPAVSLAGGHDATFRAACECIRFGLDDAATWRCMEWWNTNKCVPPWTTRELDHKIQDARKAVAKSGRVGIRVEPEPTGFERRVLATPNGAVELSAGVVAGEPYMRRFSDIKPQDIKWLWRDRIPQSKLTIVAGDPGLGKSFLTLDLAARVSTGAPWPDDTLPQEPGDVVLLSAEDNPEDTIWHRLNAAGANMERVYIVEGVVTEAKVSADGAPPVRPMDLAKDVYQLRLAIERCENCKLVIVDPISAYMGKADANSNTEVRGVLQPLVYTAADKGVAVVAVTHLRKGEGPALYRAVGSIGFVATCRVAWSVERDRDDPLGPVRVMKPIKSNVSPDTVGMKYALEGAGKDARVRWLDTAIALSSLVDAPEPNVYDQLAAWFDDFYPDHDWVPVAEFEQMAGPKGQGFAASTVRDMANSGGFKKARRHDRWWVGKRQANLRSIPEPSEEPDLSEVPDLDP
ncbi:MAG: bifunctional DNA primase/polymerase [Planctomycetaceae bacterium]|nr:bifunctional DNA primase/polymerase [Planctomycetaceae bacterium]